MKSEAGLQAPARTMRGGPSPERHRRRWILASPIVLVVLTVLAAVSVGLFISLAPSLPPLALPAAQAGAPVGPVDGTWQLGMGSVAGFRVQESALGLSNDVVGRTSAVTGTAVVSNDRVTSATFRIDLGTVKVGGKAQPQFAQSLDIRDYPNATFTLTRPMTLGSAFSSGATVVTTATGQLEMHGASRLVTFTVTGRGDGAALQAAGSAHIAFSDWGIKGPDSYGFLGSLANHGVAEFLLVLQRQ